MAFREAAAAAQKAGARGAHASGVFPRGKMLNQNREAAKNKGHISRYLANKCSIVSRIDCFSEVPTSVLGEKLREQVEAQLSFHETGEIPRKNLDVMKEAMVQAEEVAAEITRKLEKQEKKRLKKFEKDYTPYNPLKAYEIRDKLRQAKKDMRWDVTSCCNTSAELLNKSWNGEFAYQTLSMVDTVILPSMVGILCSTGLVGNILIVFTIIRSRKKTIPDIFICSLAVAGLVHIIGMPFLIHQWAQGGQWVFGGPLGRTITSLDSCNQFACTAIMTVMSVDRFLALVQPFQLTSWRTGYKTTCINLGLWAASFIPVLPVWVYSKVIKFKDSAESCAFDLTSPHDVLWYTLYLMITSSFFPSPLILMCCILILCYTWDIYQQNKDARCYNPSVPRQRVMKLTTMVLALVPIFILSAAPYHVMQLVNLQVEQPSLAFCLRYYLSICLSYASSSINPFLYILLSGNFRKRLSQVQRRVTEKEINNMENILKQSFEERTWIIKV
ncbi:LOW QUALITY PROTEIN: melanin-concentrating hormone receptor 2 [Bos javanicus]|uniref:LOW QUALITY PROTEIN: melanin-concentrating hormone receptor 2 n=1 Tax=Bos javanicus TaxID=9906 RepID=UPI002AA80B67|nr:LOW QUALITY PROTEIN: melanin-concentrating hormone receptor 2 [Bos javanicus]